MVHHTVALQIIINIIGAKAAMKKTVFPLFFVLDTSGRMAGEGITIVNDFMAQMLDFFNKNNIESEEIEIKIAILSYSNNAKWITNGLVNIDEFYWNDLYAYGARYLGKALNVLNDKMSKKEFSGFCGKKILPSVIFMSGGAGSYDNFFPALNYMINENRWFKESNKMIILVDEICDISIEMARKLIGSKGHIMYLNRLTETKRLIEEVYNTCIESQENCCDIEGRLEKD